MKDFARDDSAWADFLISKAALVLASIILFAALFHLVAGFEDLEAQEQLDSLARDFKNAVDETGARNFQEASQQEFQGEFQESSYCFEENELFRDSPFGGRSKNTGFRRICLSGSRSRWKEFQCCKALCLQSPAL